MRWVDSTSHRVAHVPVNNTSMSLQTLNPYRDAFRLLRERFAWDITAESRRSRRMLLALRDRHRGEKAIILCNGPSLLKVDLASIQGTYTFGLNKISLLFDKSPFRPSAIVAVNPFVIEQHERFFRESDIPLFLDSVGFARIGSRPTVAYLKSASVVRFARDVRIGYYQGYTVTFVALQLAYHMGFNRVALVGCDHNFAAKGPANAVVVAGSKDESHFDPRYFSGGVQWQLPDLLQSEVSYLLAREAFEADNRLLVNATAGGKLETLQRMTLEQFLSL
jgi:hypothetical protein